MNLGYTFSNYGAQLRYRYSGLSTSCFVLFTEALRIKFWLTEQSHVEEGRGSKALTMTMTPRHFPRLP